MHRTNFGENKHDIMKKTLILIALLFMSFGSYAQFNGSQLDETVKSLSLRGLSNEAIKDVLNGTLNNPQLYNDAWKSLIDYAIKKDSTRWDFLNDLNIQFKTFQSINNNSSALGFSYDFNFNYSNFVKKDNGRISNTLSFKLNGNVAFNRNVNPNDFLETSLDYSYTMFKGGVVKQKDTAIFTKLNQIEDKLVTMKDPNSPEAQKLWTEFGEYLKFSNQYYIAFGPKLSLESNQDFTKKQFVYSADLSLGAKSWDKNSTLSKLNILDYPFALIRWIVGTDSKFQPYGSTIPTLSAGINSVNPINDFSRQAIVGNLDPFPRMRFESSFRTFVSRVEQENIFFNANIRYYKEIDASAAIKAAKLDEHFYFVMALQTTSGFYVSYAKGSLPFDALSDEVYAVGFQYKF